MTDAEKLDDMQKRIKKMELMSTIQFTVFVLGILGITILGYNLSKRG